MFERELQQVAVATQRVLTDLPDRQDAEGLYAKLYYGLVDSAFDKDVEAREARTEVETALRWFPEYISALVQDDSQYRQILGHFILDRVTQIAQRESPVEYVTEARLFAKSHAQLLGVTASNLRDLQLIEDIVATNKANSPLHEWLVIIRKDFFEPGRDALKGNILVGMEDALGRLNRGYGALAHLWGTLSKRSGYPALAFHAPELVEGSASSSAEAELAIALLGEILGSGTQVIEHSGGELPQIQTSIRDDVLGQGDRTQPLFPLSFRTHILASLLSLVPSQTEPAEKLVAVERAIVKGMNGPVITDELMNSLDTARHCQSNSRIGLREGLDALLNIIDELEAPTQLQTAGETFWRIREACCQNVRETIKDLLAKDTKKLR